MPKGTCSITRAERFAAKVNPEGPVPAHRPELGACSYWTGCLHRKGYGLFWDGKQSVGAHRWAWEQEHGPVPEGLELDHLCHDASTCTGGIACPHRRCVNIAHLEAVPHQVNMQRGAGGATSGARQRAKTHCPAGHLYNEIHTGLTPDGRRYCRTCKRDQTRERRARNRQEAERQSRLSTSP